MRTQIWIISLQGGLGPTVSEVMPISICSPKNMGKKLPNELWARPVHPLLKTTLTGLRRTYLRFLVFRPKLTKTKRFPPFLDHINGKLFLGSSRFWSGKFGPKLAVGGHWSKCPAELSFNFNGCPAGNPLFLTDKIYFRQVSHLSQNELWALG